MNLYANEIRQINAEAFSGLSKLRRLILKANVLVSPPPLTFIRSSLTDLDLSLNNLAYIPSLYFYGCSVLQFLTLRSNKLSAMPDLKFLAGSIRTVDVAFNLIVDVTALYDHKYDRLRHLVLNGNNLEEFCLPSRQFAPLLQDVMLHGNNLTTIQLPPKDFYSTRLSLHNNPWHCGQSLSWVRHCFLDGFALTCPRGVILDLITCDSPANLKGMSPLDVGKTCKGTSDVVVLLLNLILIWTIGCASNQFTIGFRRNDGQKNSLQRPFSIKCSTAKW